MSIGLKGRMRPLTLAVAGIAVSMAGPALAHDWTPHSAAALLDESFPTAQACQDALDAARAEKDPSRSVHGLSYVRLFEQGRCRSFHRKDGLAWRIRMHWEPREAAAPKQG